MSSAKTISRQTSTPIPQNDIPVDIPELSNRDWLSSILKRTKLGPFGITVLAVIINLAINIPLALYFRAWFPGPISQGLALEPAAWFTDFLAIPAIIGYFWWIQHSGKELFNELIEEKVISTDEDLEEILNKSSQWMQSKWAVIIASVFGLIFSVWFFITFTLFSETTFASWVIVHPAIPLIRMMPVAWPRLAASLQNSVI